MRRLERSCVTLSIWGKMQASVQLAVSCVALFVCLFGGHDKFFSILSSSSWEDGCVIAQSMGTVFIKMFFTHKSLCKTTESLTNQFFLGFYGTNFIISYGGLRSLALLSTCFCLQKSSTAFDLVLFLRYLNSVWINPNYSTVCQYWADCTVLVCNIDGMQTAFYTQA